MKNKHKNKARNYATRDVLKTLMEITKVVSEESDLYFSPTYIKRELPRHINGLTSSEYFNGDGSPEYGFIQDQDVSVLLAPYVKDEFVLQKELKLAMLKGKEVNSILTYKGYRMNLDKNKLDELEKNIPDLFESD